MTTRPAKNSPRHIAPSPTLVRWCKFNLVGGIGIGVQFAVLFLLNSALHFHYLAATAIAVEAAVIHNFVWHERFTWADRTMLPKRRPGAKWQSCGFGWRSAFSAASKRLFSGRASAPAVLCYGPSLRRFLRFHGTTGAVSMLGNLALMRALVGQGQTNYLLANAIAITLCSLANFLVSETWVFKERSEKRHPVILRGAE